MKKASLVLESSFIGVGANVVSSCLAWQPHESVCSDTFAAFGAGASVALFSLSHNAIVATFCGEDSSSAVNKVRWLDNSTLFACSNQGLLIVELDDKDRTNPEKAKVRFQRLSVRADQQFHGLCVIANARGKDETLVVLSGTHVVSFVYCKSLGTCVVQEDSLISLPGKQLSECVSGAMLPRSKIAVVAVGGADRRIHLYVDEERKGLQYIAWVEGHQDWIRDLSFCQDAMTGDVLLASASSDTFIRLWRIARKESMEVEVAGSVQEAESRQKIVFVARDHGGNVPMFSVSLDALFVGHSHFVHSVCWSADGRHVVSASMDKTMIVWEKDAEEGVWIDRFRVGEIGGNSLGFYGAGFSPDGKFVMGHSFNGSLHLWTQKKNGVGYEPLPTVSGHTLPVTDIAWDQQGRYFVSCSHDQTVRLWCPVSNNSGQWRLGWTELARPQIHGHDINSITLLPAREHVLLSGAEEKTIRVFGATQAFIESLQNVSGAATAQGGPARPFGATLPPLGLSNKPLNTVGDVQSADAARLDEAFPDEVWRAQPIVLASPPVETLLAQSTLWPEEEKLYGHGSELFALSSNHAGTLVASACKGKAKPHTDVLLWSTLNWKLVGRLSRHKMTVTRIAFSPSDEFVATVSRDLKLCLWRRKKDDPLLYELSWELEKAHSRIIWDCCWSKNGTELLTCSRDKKICVWALDEVAGTLELSSSVKRSVGLTSIAHHPHLDMVAVGNEIGGISFWSTASAKWTQLAELNNIHCQLPVTRVLFGKVPAQGSIMLLSCGEDRSVRLTRVALTDSFSQLMALILCCQKQLRITIPVIVLRMIKQMLA